MRPVNLLPAQHRPRSGGGEGSKSSYIALGVLAGLVIAVFAYVTTSNSVSSNKADLADAQQRIQAAESQAVTLQSYGDFAGTKEARVAAVKELATTRLDWERLFRELAHVLPAKVYLTSFDGTAGGAPDGTTPTGTGTDAPAGPTVKLEGCAAGHSGVADVMLRLRGLHGVEDVELGESKEPEQGGVAVANAGATNTGSTCGDYTSFQIDVTLAQAAQALAADGGPAEVPARLGGGE